MRTVFRFISKLILTAFLLAIVAVCVIGYSYFVEPNILKAESETIDSTHISGQLTIALFADTHFSENYTPEDFSKVTEAVSEASPDIIIFAGDLIDELDTYEGSTSDISDALASMYAPMGKYAVFGNHDYGGGAENYYEGIMNAGGFKVLFNESAYFEDYNTVLMGIDDCAIGYGDIELTDRLGSETFNIVMCHEPDLIDTVLDDTNIDLMLSGHSHGGQVHLPVITEHFLPVYGEKYTRGLYTFDNARVTQLYVTRGLGTTQQPIRFMSVPEVTFITVI